MAERTSGRVTAKSTLAPQSAGTSPNLAALIAAKKPFNPWTHPERLEVNLAFVDVEESKDILNDGRLDPVPPPVGESA